MKALLVILLSIVGLARAQLNFVPTSGRLTTTEINSFCTNPAGSYNVPHPTNCSQFIQCTGSIGTVHTCLNGTWFDENILVCRSPSVAQCAHVPSNDIPEYVLQICSNLPVGQTIPAESCSHYYVCYGNKAFQLNCPNGQHYSRAYTACMNPLLAGCRALNTMCVGQYNDFAFPALTCENYYVCDANLMPVLNACPSGQYFSANEQNCTSPQQSGCVNVDVPTVAPPTTTPPPCTTVAPAPMCNANNTGAFFPHEQCNWFYMCFNSTPLEFKCECGQYYSVVKGCCVIDTGKICIATQ